MYKRGSAATSPFSFLSRFYFFFANLTGLILTEQGELLFRTAHDVLLKLESVRARGVAHDNEELEIGVRCIAAGVYDDAGKLVAGLSISAPADRLELAWAERVKATAQDISRALGHEAPAKARS